MLSVGFLSSQNYLSRATFSGTLFSMRAALKRRPLRVVDLGWPLTPGLAEKVRRRLGLNGDLGLEGAHQRLVARLFRAVVRAQLRRQPCDVLFAPVAACELYEWELDAPVVYASDTTFRLFREHYAPTMPAGPSALGEAAERWAVGHAARLLYPSRWAAASATEDYGAAPERIDLASYGANLEVGEVSDERLTERCRGSAIKLLFVGRDLERKGGRIALEAFAQLRASGVAASLVMVGAALPDAPPPGVEVIPYLDKDDPADAAALIRLYLESHFLVFPTRADCSPIVLCEAAACGLPVVAASVGGVPDLVRDGETGALLPVSAPASAYVEVMRSLWSRRDAYEEIVRAARRAYVERLNWDAWGRAAEVSLRRAVGLAEVSDPSGAGLGSRPFVA